MAEKSILDMSNEELFAMIQRNKVLREEATAEKMIQKEKERKEKEVKIKAKGQGDVVADMLKAFLQGKDVEKKKK